MDNIKINVIFPKATEIKRDLDNVLKSVGRESQIKLDLDISDFSKTISDVSQSLAKLKSQMSGVKGLDNLVEIASINASTKAIERQTEAIQNQQKIMENVVKTSNTKMIDSSGNENIIKDLETIRDEYGNLIEVVNKYDSKTGELKNTLVTTTNEIEKQEKQAEKALKSIENLKGGLQEKLNKTLSNQNFNLIDDSVFTNLQAKINSINTNMPEKEINELKVALSNLNSSDSQIIRLQNAIEKNGIAISSLKDKYKDLVPKNELKIAEDRINTLKNALQQMQTNGGGHSSNGITSMLNDASSSMKSLTNATKNASEEQRLYNKEVVTFGSAFKDVATKVGVFSLVYTGINQIQNAFRDGVQSVIDMDGALADLNKVVDFSSSQLLEMRDSAVSLGVALGTNSTDVAKAMSEFGRQYKDIETIKSMTQTAILGSNVMDGTNADQVAKGLTTIISAMKLEVTDAIKIIDSLNEVQNNYRISADSMLEGLSQVGSVAKTAGASLEELEGYITSISVSTGDGGSEVGNALKSIISRIYKVGSEGIESAGKPAQALEEIGIAVRDLEGNFRPINDILSDLNIKWKTLTETEKIYIGQQVGGTHRFNSMIALMNNFDMAIDSTSTAMNSLGSATKENEIYLNSIEGRMSSLKATTEGFWYDFISSDLIKGGVSALQSLISTLGGLQNTFGSLGLSVGALTTGFLLFTNNPLKKFSTRIIENKELTKILSVGLSELKGGLEKTAIANGTLNSSMTKTQKTGVLLKTGFKALGLEAVATQIKVMALQAVLSVGLSLAISAIVGVISSFVSSLGDADERIQAVSESSKALADSLEGIKNLEFNIRDYEEINKKLKDMTISEEERNELNDKLLQIKEQLYASDDSAYSILNNQNLSYQEQLDLLKQINDAKLIDKAEELDKQLGNGFWNRDEEKNANEAKLDIENNVKILKELVALQEEAKGGTISHPLMGILNADEQAQAIDNLKNRISESNLVLQKYNSDVELIKKTNIDTDRSTVNLSNGIFDFIKNLGKSTEEINANTEAKEKNSNVEDVGSSVATVDISEATKAYGEAISKTKELESLINDVNEAQSLTPEILTSVIEKFPEIGARVSSVADVQEFLNGKISESVDAQAQAYDQMVANDTTYYNSKISNNDGLQKNFNALLSSFVTNSGEAYSTDLGNYTSLAALKAELTNQFGSTVAELITNFVTSQANGYDVDLDNTVEWAKNKSKILKDLDNNITQIENRMAESSQKISKKLLDVDISQMTDQDSKNLLKAYEHDAKLLGDLKTQQSEIKTEFSKYASGFKGYTPTFSGTDFETSDTGSSSKDSSSAEKEIENLELERDRYFELEEALKKVNNELDKNNSLKDKQVTDSVLEKEISLLKQTISLNKKLRDEKVKQSAELKNNIKSWFSFDKDGFIKNYDEVLARLENWTNSVSGDQKENRKNIAQSIVDDAKNYMDLINSDIPDIDKTILDTTNKITDAMTNQVELKIKSITKTIDTLAKAYEDKVENLDFKKSYFADYSYTDNIKFNKEELSIAKEYLLNLEKEYTKLNKVIGTTSESKESLSEAIQDINDKIQKEKLNVLELTKEQEKLNLAMKESAYQNKKWQKGTQQMNKIELELQVTDEDDVAKQVQLMNEKLKLQQSMLKDTEKYLQDLRNTSVTTAEGYGDLVDKLMSAEEELYSQQSAVNSLKDSMDSLLSETMTKYINQLKEIEQLELDVRQQRESQALDEEYFKVSEKDFNAYRKEKISSINEEIKLLKDKLVVEGSNSALLDLLKAKQKELLSVEEARYETINDWYSVQEDMHSFNISKIDEELKALEEKNALEEENEARLEKQNELIEIQKELTNIKNNKKIRELSKNADGSWGFEYTYDKEEYENTEKQYKEKQEDLVEWEKDLELEKYKSKLEQQKEYEQEALNSLKELYDKQKEILDQLHDEENEALEEKYNGMLDDLDSYLEKLTQKFGNDVPEIIKTLQAELDKGETILKDFGKSLSDLLENTSVDEKQKEEFFKLFEDRYNDVIVGTTKFFETQKSMRIVANDKEIQDVQNQGTKVNQQTTSNLTTLADIYKNGWDSIMSSIENILMTGTEKIESFNQQIISSTSQAISEIGRLQSAYENMQRIIASTNQTSMPDVSRSSIENAKGSTNVVNTINASFPHATNSSEIEKALNNLATRAIQYDK